jgi:hypothetical protein
MRLLGTLALVAGLAAMFAGPAQAETNFPVIGGSGNGSFEDRCPAGQYLTGIKGHAGAWTDEVQIVCQRIYGQPDPRDPSRMVRYYFFDSRLAYLGAPRGGGGGGPIDALCPQSEVIGLFTFMTNENRQVKAFTLTCNGKNGGDEFYVQFNLSRATVSLNYNFHSDAPGRQRCPTGEVGVGVRGRYGQDVNALSLICDTFIVPPLKNTSLNPNQPLPIQPFPYKPVQSTPSPARSNLPIKVTGVQSGGANRFPASLFPGDWAVSSSAGDAFELDLVQLTSGLFGEITDGNDLDKGTVRGTQSDSMHAQLTLKQPGLDRSGIISITVSSDGNSFTGSGTLSNGQAVTWQGTKKHPAAH